MDKLSFKNIFLNLSIYGVMHFLVDLICAGIIFSIFKNQIVSTSQFAALLILYCVLAFGLQPIFGFVSDQFTISRGATLVGCIFVVVSAFIFMYYPLTSIILAGLGNAMFHIGGGVVSLNLIPNKAFAPGVFVAPGAMGLLIGTILGNKGSFVSWPFAIILALLCLSIFFIVKVNIDYKIRNKKINFDKYFVIALALIFFSIIIRSFIGGTMSFSWKSNVVLLVILTTAVVIGKGVGGFMADKIGWIRVGVGSLILSIPFLVLGASYPLCGIIGTFLFNMTMPITLVAIFELIPGYPGFSFGLTCLALFLGATPLFFWKVNILDERYWVFALIVFVSAISLLIGLRIFSRNVNCEVDNKNEFNN